MQGANTEKGFTIVELLMTIALLAILIPALTVGLSTLTQLNYRARDLTLVSIAAENKIESLRSLGYNSLTIGTTDFSSELSSEINGPKTAQYTTTQYSGYIQVDLTITYRDFGTQKSVRYASIISETGVAQ